MRKILALLACLIATPAAADYAATQGAGTNFGSAVVSTVHYPRMLWCDPTTPTQCAAIDASGRVTLVPNQSINVGQINGVTPLMGNGATGTGSPRVTLSNDNTIPTGWPTAANQTSQITQETAINTVLGLQADSVCGSATGTCTLQALIKFLNTAATAPVPVSINGTATAQTGITQGTTPSGARTGAEVVDMPGSASPTDCSASTSGTPSTATTLLTAGITHRKMDVKVEGATAVCFNRVGGTASIGTAGTFCLKGATTANAGDGGSWSTPPGRTEPSAWSMISTGTSILVSCTWQ